MSENRISIKIAFVASFKNTPQILLKWFGKMKGKRSLKRGFIVTNIKVYIINPFFIKVVVTLASSELGF